MTAPAPSDADLCARLRELADCDARAGEPLGICMRDAAARIESLSAQLAERDAEIENIKAVEFPRRLDIVTANWRKRAKAAEARAKALLTLAKWLRSQTSCEHYHHAKNERHIDLPCPVEVRIDAALAASGGADEGRER